MSIQAINVRNQFRGKVKEIIRGDVVSEIDVETPWLGQPARTRRGQRGGGTGQIDRSVHRQAVAGLHGRPPPCAFEGRRAC